MNFIYLYISLVNVFVGLIHLISVFQSFLSISPSHSHGGHKNTATAKNGIPWSSNNDTMIEFWLE